MPPSVRILLAVRGRRLQRAAVSDAAHMLPSEQDRPVAVALAAQDGSALDTAGLSHLA
ncbi:hypothetical protein ACIA8H_31575 [Streptomyces goshikiensis]|uniref:hypothetical protein n=1 Tax=Streptomyces goshikiensis TaxID=1942 RepID=UPI0037B911EB